MLASSKQKTIIIISAVSSFLLLILLMAYLIHRFYKKGFEMYNQSKDTKSSDEQIHSEAASKYRPSSSQERERKEEKRKRRQKHVSVYNTQQEMIKHEKVYSDDDERATDDSGEVRVMVVDFRNPKEVERQILKRVEKEKDERKKELEKTAASKGHSEEQSQTKSNLFDDATGKKGGSQLEPSLVDQVEINLKSELENQYEPRFLSNNSVLRRVWELDRQEVNK
jgi:hypothetical protein